MSKIKIIYILGSGHSGSTLLDIYLGSALGGESLGEIIWINQWIDKRNKRRCPCGEKLNECQLWGPALSGWLADIDPQGLSSYKALQPNFETPKSPSLYMLSRQKKIRSTDFIKYEELTYLLFKNIQSVNTAQYIVDSPKFPPRAFALLNNPYLDVFIIHLIKDPRAIAYSAIKRKKTSKTINPRWALPPDIWHLSLCWLMNNMQSDAIVKEAGDKRSLRVKYQDFALHPEKTL